MEPAVAKSPRSIDTAMAVAHGHLYPPTDKAAEAGLYVPQRAQQRHRRAQRHGQKKLVDAAAYDRVDELFLVFPVKRAGAVRIGKMRGGLIRKRRKRRDDVRARRRVYYDRVARAVIDLCLRHAVNGAEVCFKYIRL